MTPNEISLVSAQLLKLAVAAPGKALEALEWGSGGSTVYFPRVLKEAGHRVRWVSLEYNAAWYRELLKSELSGVELHLFDVGNTRLKRRYENMDEYVAFPATLGRRFDFILVDGRKRRRCLLEAAAMLNPGGVVMLHDADRPYYHCAFSAYDGSGEFITPQLWVGRATSA